MKVVEPWVWHEIDWFWFCFERRAGWNGWELQRTSLPEEGPVGDQDHFRMWCQQILSTEFIRLQQEQGDEQKRAQELTKLHEHTRKQHG